MVNKKLLVISYCCVFISIYFATLAYAAFSLSLKDSNFINLPQTESLNATTNAVSALSDFTSVPITIIAVLVLTIVLVFIIIGTRAMSGAV